MRDKDPALGELLNLKSNELLYAPLEEFHARALRELGGHAVTRYPSYTRVVAGIADGFGVSPAHVWISAGSDAGVALVCEALAATRRRLILHVPAYEAWAPYAALRRLAVTEVGFAVDEPPDAVADSLAAELRAARPSVVSLSNPNGPTGYELPEPTIRMLCEVAAEAGHVLVIDACYQAFGTVDHVALPASYDNVVVLHSFSKAYGLAGARIAAIVAAPRVIAYLRLWRSDGPVSGTAIALLEKTLANVDAVREAQAAVVAARDALVAAVAERRPSWRPVPSGGNFVLFGVGDADEAREFTKGMRARGILVRDTSDVVGAGPSVRLTVPTGGAFAATVDALTTVA